MKRAEIRAENNGQDQRKRITLKVDTPSTIEFVDKAIKRFNLEDLGAGKSTIRDCFTKVGQNPWYKDEDQLLVVRLEALKDSAHFARDVEDGLLEGNTHAFIGADAEIPYEM